MADSAFRRSSGAAGALTPWARHLALLAITAALLLLLCREDVVAIIAIWSRTGAFHHCFLIPPIVAWLVWQRRAMLARLSPGYSWLGVAIVFFGSLLWLAGAAGYIAIARQAGLVIAGQGLVVALLGRPVARALIFPICFSLFLIPAGTEFEPLLQTITASIAVALLHATGTAATLEGVFIDTPAGLFRIAEACSGTAFLLAMAAYGALVAQMCFRRWSWRAAFMAAAMATAVLTNGVRAFAIMKLANLTSIHNPMVQDHLLFGWLLFAAMLALLMLASARWFDRAADAPLIEASALQGVRQGREKGAVIVTALFVALFIPRLWHMASTLPPSAVSQPPAAPTLPGWSVLPGVYRADWQPHFDGATWIGQWRYRRASDGRTADLAVIVYDRQEEGRELVGFGQGAVAPEGDWAVMDDAAGRDGVGQWLRGPGGRVRYVATWYVVGGTVTGNDVVAKLAGIRARLPGGDPRAAAILVSVAQSSGVSAPAIAQDFVQSAGSVQEMADRARRMR